MKKVAGRLRLDLAQYRELAAFAQFGSDLDKATQAQLTRGERMVEVLKQRNLAPMSFDQQVMVIYAGTQGMLDDIPVTAIRTFEEELLQFMEQRYADVGHDIRNSKDLPAPAEAKLKAAITEFKGQFMARRTDGKPAAVAAR
jgi:F-type H+-transporting ATPase subunit alpha